MNIHPYHPQTTDDAPARVLGLGAGGHAKVVIDALRLRDEVAIVGLLDASAHLHGTLVGGVPVLGDDRLLHTLGQQGVAHVFVGIGTARSTVPRQRLYELALAHECSIIDVVHPAAVVSPSARLGTGTTILAQAIVNAEARLGHNVIVNSGAIVEHDCVLGDHVHVASGARLAGSVQVGSGALIGAGSVVRPGICIGQRAVVGVGAAVVRDVPDGVVVTGVPARIQQRQEAVA